MLLLCYFQSALFYFGQKLDHFWIALEITTFSIYFTMFSPHSMFKIPIKGYLTTIIEPNTTLETIKQVHLIVIDEMSMMTSIVLCVIQQCLK